MTRREVSIRALSIPDLEASLAYLEPHLAESGTPGTALFQPQSKNETWKASEHRPKMREAWGKPVGERGWSRAWAAHDSRSGHIVGHASLSGWREPHTEHRALLGTGVDRSARREGIGRALVDVAIHWAQEETSLRWIDLRVLGGNAPALALYHAIGFIEVARFADMFRIDGESIDDIFMTKCIRP